MPPITAPSAAVSQSCKARSGISLHLARFEASHVEESRDTSSWPAQIALWNKCAACSSSSVTALIKQVLSDGAPGTKLKARRREAMSRCHGLGLGDGGWLLQRSEAAERFPLQYTLGFTQLPFPLPLSDGSAVISHAARQLERSSPRGCVPVPVSNVPHSSKGAAP